MWTCWLSYHHEKQTSRIQSLNTLKTWVFLTRRIFRDGVTNILGKVAIFTIETYYKTLLVREDFIFRVNSWGCKDVIIKVLANNLYVMIIEQHMTNRKNKVSWIYPSLWPRENKVTRIILSVLQYMFVFTWGIQNQSTTKRCNLILQSFCLNLLHVSYRSGGDNCETGETTPCRNPMVELFYGQYRAEGINEGIKANDSLLLCVYVYNGIIFASLNPAKNFHFNFQ